MNIKPFFSILTFMLFPFTVAASNPVVTSIFTADPATLVYNDRLYLYTGHDEAAVGGWFNMKDWHIFSTKDMVTWTDHGACLTLNKFSWASGDAWASQCVYRNNKFYWYVSTLHKTKGGHAVGVAVSDSPTGPFTDPRGTAMITTDMTPGTSTMDDIDPTVFVDDDGQAYMYWGNGTCKYVKLKDDMITVDGSVNNVTLQGFGEAPWLHKRNGIYYLSYSSSLPSTIVYCTSSKPTGPWTYKGRILQPVKNCGTSHQAIQQFRDQWYMIYHNGILPTGGDTRRSVCVDYLYYNTDGTIKEVVQTTTGVNASNPVAVNSLHEKISNTTGMIIRTHTNGCTFNVPVKQATLMIYALNGDIISKLSSSDNQIFWNGHTSDGVKVPNGNYVAKLFSPSYTATKQLILAH